ncbi:tetratricopeptide repeat protein [uncultured Rhodospira sp.]|uniref:tetratricopeptide repeat protein n=1 Tax=uncultured Rhodospira sp. TaxID=1936189 RepID=UPI00260960AE|nr:tetratricopeptide repeat protein [uncultured Rhodospira sp.]
MSDDRTLGTVTQAAGRTRPGGARTFTRAAAVAVTLALAPAACAQPTPPVDPEAGATVLAAGPDGVSSPKPREPERGDDEAAASGRALGHYLAGRAAQHANDIPAAARHYAAAMDGDPDNPLLMRRAYYYLAADGRFEEAVSVARRTLEALPDEDFAPLLLATDAMRRGAPREAVAQLDSVEPRGLNGLLQPLTAAWAHLAANGLDPALDALEPARGLVSARRLVDLHAALLSWVAGDDTQALDRLDAYLDEGPPDNARPLELVAMMLVDLDRLDQARELMDAFAAGGPVPLVISDLADRLEAEGASAMPTLVSDATEGFAEALYHTGLVLNQGQGSETGILLTRLALAVKPDFPRATLAIAETLRRLDRFEAADAVLAGMDTSGEPALDYVVQLYRAENLENLDRIDEALGRYDALAAAHPDQVEPLVDKGDLLRRNDRFAESAQAYGQAVERMDDDDPMLWAVLYRRGIAFERSGEWDKAEADFLRALEMEPDQPEVLNYLGYSWLDRGEHIERAVAMIKDAVRQRPDDGYIVDSLGWGYYLLGRYQDAVRKLERAVELRPQDWTINDHLGDAYWRVGRRTEARFQWERALSLEPDEDKVEAIEAKIADGLEPDGRAARESSR